MDNKPNTKNTVNVEQLEKFRADCRQELTFMFERLRRDMTMIANSPAPYKREFLDEAFKHFTLGFMLMQDSLTPVKFVVLPEDNMEKEYPINE